MHLCAGSARHRLCAGALQRPLPVDMEGAAGWEGAGNVGGYWTMVVLPHHVSTPARLDTMAWALLTLPAHLDAAVKGFKVPAAQPVPALPVPSTVSLFLSSRGRPQCGLHVWVDPMHPLQGFAA
jgi:hypothetical protein